MKIVQLLYSICLIQSCLYAESFKFTFEPIDVVIPCHAKDKKTIDLVIDGIRTNAKNIRRIIVISANQITDKAEWFAESRFPFTPKNIAFEILKDKQKAQAFIDSEQSKIGWIYQQLLKIYSMFIIPRVSSNVLIVDADTIFLRPISFQDPKTGAGYYNPGYDIYLPYFMYNARILPRIKRKFVNYSGVVHHMLYQRSVLESLFKSIKKEHKKEPWQVFCAMIDKNMLSTSSMSVDYELYFNYVFSKTDAVKIRHLKYLNIPFEQFDTFKNKNYDYLSCHSYLSDTSGES